MDVQTGREKWKFKTGGPITFSSPAAVGGLVYIGSFDDHLYAVDGQSGRERWRFKTEGDLLSSPGVADGVVYVGGYDGLYALR